MASLLDLARPRTSLGFMFPEVEVASLRAWLRSGTVGPALATASTGAGLTTLVATLVRETGLEPVWISAASTRVRQLLEAAGANPVSVTMRRKIIVVDEFDALGSGGESSVASECLSFAKGARVAMLFLSHWTRSQKSMEFAKKWAAFHLGRPAAKAMHAYLAGVAAAHAIPVADPELAQLATRVRGDVRAALMALDLMRCSGGGGGGQRQPALKDEAVDALDLVEEVLRGDRGHTVRECMELFGMEGAVLPMGIYENYLGCCAKDLGAAAAVAEGFSVADTFDRYLYAHQAWDFLYESYGVFSVAVPSLALRRLACPVKVSVTKFGSLWSKVYNACAKTKHLRGLATARAEHGLSALDACDLAYLRAMLRQALARGDEAVRAVCHPLGAAHVLHMARLDATGDSSWYKQSSHARVKRALHSTCDTMSDSARAKKSGGCVPSSRTTGTPA